MPEQLASVGSANRRRMSPSSSGDKSGNPVNQCTYPRRLGADVSLSHPHLSDGGLMDRDIRLLCE